MNENEKKKDTFQVYREIIEKFSPCMNDYLYILDLKLDCYFISPQACKRFALPGKHFSSAARVHQQFVHRDDYSMLMEDLQQLKDGKKEEHNLKYRWIGVDGSPIWVNCRGQVLRDEENRVRYMIGCINEIGRKQIADNTSGLMGEVSFIHDISEMGTFSRGFLLRIGIDDFKKINEKNGVRYGDHVLQRVARFITECLKPDQKVYRIVADEFLITDFSSRSAEEAKEIYYSVRNKVEDFLDAQKYEVLYTISAGILTPQEIPSEGYEDLLKLSQFALSQAKLYGKNQYYQFKTEDYRGFLRKRKIEKILRNAVSDNFKGFSLAYQPIIQTQSEHPFAAESLLRFTSEEGERISPFEMVPCLERTGLIIPVGKWIMKTAFAACREFCTYDPGFKVAVNLSYVQILKSNVFEDIKEAMDELEISGNNIIVELTESGNLENNINVLNTWNKLKDMGVQIAVDDFGTGYSNFSHIGELRPDYVKIDHQFTMKAFKNEFDFLLLENIIQLAHNLKLQFVVEGIEKREDIEKILKFCPEYIQGFYFGKPCDKENLISQFFFS